MGAGKDFELLLLVEGDCDEGVGLVGDGVHGRAVFVEEQLVDYVGLSLC